MFLFLVNDLNDVFTVSFIIKSPSGTSSGCVYFAFGESSSTNNPKSPCSGKGMLVQR